MLQLDILVCDVISAFCVVYIHTVKFDGYIHLSHCNLHSLLCLGVVFTPMVALHTMSKSTTGCTTGCVFSSSMSFVWLCHVGLFALPLPPGHMFPKLKCMFAS